MVTVQQFTAMAQLAADLYDLVEQREQERDRALAQLGELQARITELEQPKPRKRASRA